MHFGIAEEIKPEDIKLKWQGIKNVYDFPDPTPNNFEIVGPSPSLFLT